MRFLTLFFSTAMLVACAVMSTGWEKFTPDTQDTACSSIDEPKKSVCLGELAAYKKTQRACELSNKKYKSDREECLRHNSAIFALYKDSAKRQADKYAWKTRTKFNYTWFAKMLNEWRPNCKTTGDKFKKCDL